jgi:nucleoside-diphosphate-sugar epimerase
MAHERPGTAAIVTGGSGFIGSHLVSDLDRDPSITRIFILDQDPPTFRSAKVEFIRCDLSQTITWFPPALWASTQCFHLAAICREPGYSWDEYFRGNYLVARNVAKWASASAIDHIVFSSTAMVFRASEARNSESALPNPDTAYGISKALAEEVFRGWAAEDANRRLHILRPGVVFGKGGGGNFVTLHRALRRNLFCYVGRSTTVKSAIYVKDLVRILRVAGSGQLAPATYHALYDEPLTVERICEAFCSVYGWRRYIPVLPYKALLAAATPFELANALGLKNPIHRRRIEKLYHSTHLSAAGLGEANFPLEFDIVEAIKDWRADCYPRDLY